MQDEPELLPVIESWDTYWQGAQTKGAYTGGGSEHPLVLSFWDEYFKSIRSRNRKPRVIDIASGNGAVVGHARRVFEGVPPGFTCLDVSSSAIRILQERFPGIRGVVADAAEIPLDPARFDVVTSQFGVEYAGLGAIKALERLLAPGGELALLLHHRDGIIFQECTASLAAVREMQSAEFIPRCSAMFEAGFAVLQGSDPQPYKTAGRALAPAIRAMEEIMKRYGRDVASGTIVRIYRDVRTIHQRIRHYEPTSVLEWLEQMQAAIEAYAGRMASMRQAAIDETAFEEVCADLTDKGCSLLRSEPLVRSPGDPPVAWALIARRE